MPSHQALKDDQLLAEMYSGMAGGSLLLETPATAANIERFMKKYMPIVIPPETPPDQIERLRGFAKEFLDSWTPRLQQIIKAAGGNPDIFAYSNVNELNKIIADSQTSKTDEKKAYKAASNANIPLVFETDKYAVYQPKTWEASRKYFGINRESLLDGTKKKGATWCTAAAEDPKHFNDYVVKAKDRLLYFIRKKDDKLFAARSRSLSLYTADSIKDRVKSADKTLDAYISYKPQTIADTPKSRTLSQMTEDIYHFASSMDYAGSLAWPLIECRNQTNGSIRIDKLFFELVNDSISDPKAYAEEFKKFMHLVVFGRK